MYNDNKIEMNELVEKNCMDYAKYVITDRAIVDLRDGNKNIHRRIIWSMHLDGLQHNKNRTKSVNAVGSVLRFSPHGDSSVYQACVRLANDSVNYQLIDGKGSFGSVTSKDIVAGASRYTEMRLSPITQEYLKDINKDIVPMVNNYDDTRLEPEILPTTFPTILCQPNSGIAVGISSTICPFDMSDVIASTINIIKGKKTMVMIPTFPTGASIIYNEKTFKQLKETGLGSFKLRSKYHIENNSIVVTEIPYTTTREAIISSVIGLVRDKKNKDILDINDYSGVNGLNITIDIRKNTNIDVLMAKLFKSTPLEDSFSCNFTVLNNKIPMVLGTDEILSQWVEFRRGCIRKSLEYDLKSREDKLHLLVGLEKVLLDIDKAIDIIKNTDDDKLLPELSDNFDIDDVQAEYISNIKLKNINNKFIQKQIKDIKLFKKEVKYIEYQLSNSSELDKIIISDLERVKSTYAKPRKTEIIFEDTITNISKDDLIEDYSCNIIYTKENYLKKTLRYSETQKVKDGDMVVSMTQTTNKGEVILISNLGNAYKLQINDLVPKQPSALGDYIPSLIALKEEEIILGCLATNDFKGYSVITYENGKIAKIDLKSYQTSTKRSKLANSLYLDNSVVSIIQANDNVDLYLESSQDKALIINTKNINSKGARNTQGVEVMSSNKDNFKITKAEIFNGQVEERYRVEKKSSGKKI